MNLELHFPTPVWWENTGIDTSGMVDLTYRLINQDPTGRQVSNQGGWQSSDFRPGTYPELASIEKKIIHQSHACVRDYGYNVQTSSIFLENLWINVNRRSNSNSIHTHPSSFISGVFYIKAHGDQGNITFYRDYNQDFNILSAARRDHLTQLNASAVMIVPETGKLIMFPSWLPHGVEVNQSYEDRISISFNLRIRMKDEDNHSR